MAENPCTFKKECKSCVQANLRDRPHFCEQLECDHYTPCKKCKMNRILDREGLCNVCVTTEKQKKKNQEEFIKLDEQGDLIKTTKALQDALDEDEITPPTRKISISMPGTPPAEYSNSEKEIYLTQWGEYKGFYRDPTAKTILHSIIILEIELNWLLNEMISQRSKPTKELEQQRLRIIRSLGELHDQLPKREANEESDDEKFFSMVYERYITELKERRIGKVSRILSPEALALAPQLHFPLNPQTLLTNLGYRTVDAIQACEQIAFADLPREPKKALEFFGIYLDEKYALPLNEQPQFDDEESLPSVADPSLASDANDSDQPTDDD